MVSSGKGRLFKRADGKFLIYLPKDLGDDSMFPFSESDSIHVRVSFVPKGPKKLIIEPYKEPVEPEVQET